MDVLIDKFYKEFTYTSRYLPCPNYYHVLDDKYITGTASWLNDETQATAYTVQKGDTYDSLALYYYNNPTLYWVICSYNRVVDPFTDPIPGQIIYIPSISNIEFEKK